MTFRSKQLLRRFSDISKPEPDVIGAAAAAESAAPDQEPDTAPDRDAPTPASSVESLDLSETASDESDQAVAVEPRVQDPESGLNGNGEETSDRLLTLQGAMSTADAILAGFKEIRATEEIESSQFAPEPPQPQGPARVEDEPRRASRDHSGPLSAQQIESFRMEFRDRLRQEQTDTPSPEPSPVPSQPSDEEWQFEPALISTEEGAAGVAEEGAAGARVPTPPDLDIPDIPPLPQATKGVADDLFDQFFSTNQSDRKGQGDSLAVRVSLDHMVAVPDLESFHEPLSPPENADLYVRAVSYVLRVFREAQAGVPPELSATERLANELIESSLQDRSLLLSATDRHQEFAASSHSVNVTILAIHVAQQLGYIGQRLQRVAVASLLHEIGVIRLPEKLLHRSGSITEQEIRALRSRPALTNRLLAQMAPTNEWLAQITGQVFERENGQGLPFGLSGPEILEEAKIIAVADVFDACIHKRPYRDALTGYQTLFEITTDGSDSFSEKVVKALIRTLSLYPYNEYVLLDTGEIGRVVEINKDNLSRPLVEVLYDTEMEALEVPQRLDLSKNPERYISKALPISALPEVRK